MFYTGLLIRCQTFKKRYPLFWFPCVCLNSYNPRLETGQVNKYLQVQAGPLRRASCKSKLSCWYTSDEKTGAERGLVCIKPPHPMQLELFVKGKVLTIGKAWGTTVKQSCVSSLQDFSIYFVCLNLQEGKLVNIQHLRCYT